MSKIMKSISAEVVFTIIGGIMVLILLFGVVGPFVGALSSGMPAESLRAKMMAQAEGIEMHSERGDETITIYRTDHGCYASMDGMYYYFSNEELN